MIHVLYILFSIFLSFLPYLFLGGLSACPDIYLYLSHGGYTGQIPLINFLYPDTLLYVILGSLNDSLVWILLVQFFSFFIFYYYCVSSQTSLSRKIFLLITPWCFSIVGAHLWLCGIRNGLSISIFTSFILLSNSGFPKSRTTRFFSFALSYLSHWSSFLISLFFYIPPFTRLSKYFFGFTIRKSRLSAFLFLFLPFVFVLGLFILPKILNYSDLFTKTDTSYGTRFPFLCLLTIPLLIFRPSTLASTKQPNLVSERFTSICSLILIFSAIMIFFGASFWNRLLVPFQFLQVIYLIKYFKLSFSSLFVLSSYFIFITYFTVTSLLRLPVIPILG